MDKATLETWKAMRQRARTDLLYLCLEVLGYKDVSRATNGPHYDMLSKVQRFKGGSEPSDVVSLKNGAGYSPAVPMWDLTGKRNSLFLVSRGFLKTTIVTQAHKIQFALNYPDVRIKLVSAKRERAEDFLRGIKEHFLRNEMFRALFPEYCPKETKSGRLEDFGDTEKFTVPNRTQAGIKEPTFSIASQDSSVAGGHYDVIDVDDLVEDQNCRTPESIEQTKKFFASLRPLVEVRDGKEGWIDLVGTIYNFSDLHYSIYDAEISKPVDQRIWKLVYVPACNNWDVDPEKAGTLRWPERVTHSYLKKIEDNPAEGPQVLYPQYLLKPLTASDGLVPKSEIKWMPAKKMDEIWARTSRAVTIDIGGIKTTAAKNDNDYTSIAYHGWGRDGRCYFRRIIHGRFQPDEIIEHMFALFVKDPMIRAFKIEQENHATVLLPFLKKLMGKDDQHPFLPLDPFPRDNQVSKVNRIKGTQPYWKNGMFVFSDDIPETTRRHLEKEVEYFPKFNHDDILDTVADSLQTRDGGVIADVTGRDKHIPEFVPDFDGQVKTWKGIPAEVVTEEMLYQADREFMSPVDDMTGF